MSYVYVPRIKVTTDAPKTGVKNIPSVVEGFRFVTILSPDMKVSKYNNLLTDNLGKILELRAMARITSHGWKQSQIRTVYVPDLRLFWDLGWE